MYFVAIGIKSLQRLRPIPPLTTASRLPTHSRFVTITFTSYIQFCGCPSSFFQCLLPCFVLLFINLVDLSLIGFRVTNKLYFGMMPRLLWRHRNSLFSHPITVASIKIVQILAIPKYLLSFHIRFSLSIKYGTYVLFNRYLTYIPSWSSIRNLCLKCLHFTISNKNSKRTSCWMFSR